MCKKVQELNDKFRISFVGGQVILTSGLTEYPQMLVAQVLSEVRNYKNFDQDNDPYNEHDFGSFDFPFIGKIFWKIDYYDEELNYHSTNPADETKTARVLTVMLADEY